MNRGLSLRMMEYQQERFDVENEKLLRLCCSTEDRDRGNTEGVDLASAAEIRRREIEAVPLSPLVPEAHRSGRIKRPRKKPRIMRQGRQVLLENK